MVKYIIEVIVYDDDGNEHIEVTDCESIEDFKEAREELENDTLKLKLYECKELKV